MDGPLRDQSEDEARGSIPYSLDAAMPESSRLRMRDECTLSFVAQRVGKLRIPSKRSALLGPAELDDFVVLLSSFWKGRAGHIVKVDQVLVSVPQVCSPREDVFGEEQCRCVTRLEFAASNPGPTERDISR